MRPLDRLSSIKIKLGVVIVAAVVVTLVVNEVGLNNNIKPAARAVAAVVLGLAMVQLLAHGMTSPLREMARAAAAMARGDYSRRVRASSRDEVGELARAFNAMAADLAQVDRQRRDLVANVSHELRTPISALRAVLENLVDGVGAPNPATLKVMLDQVDRLGRLVSQLLDLSRLESGTVPLDRREFAIAPLLERVANESRLHAPATKVTVIVDPPDQRLRADPERVHQVVSNLVENAVRHSPTGAVVEVRASTHDGAMRIAVVDAGPGIPDEEADRVFERFYRSDAARSTANGGAGLGLSIAQGIVELHGGEIRAERREPTGCRIVVTLPVAS